jgi:hypothetical protein
MNDKLAEADEKGLPPSPRWKGARSLHLAHELNSRCIDLLCDLAARPSVEGLPVMLRANRNLWYRLDPEARWRLAAFPFVIVDFRFRDEAWWRGRGSVENHAVAECPAGDALPLESRESLLLETMMFAWQVAREDQRVAQILFAMTQPVARLVSSLAMQEIRALAIDRSTPLRVRWENNAQLWRELLLAAATEDEEALEEVRLHAKLLFCGDLISLSSES